ncbi:ATP-dependent protease ClpP, protease subunit [Desulfomicrobium apsheronum]|uniref:ATP-dependent Clp protease proteolytic subunit n=1 Tax=Desulfomicrobium apsheronum TaxID=52560 RepID=A0A1I3ZGY2_9BACT|nr:head maturation protease, ClpP-related [Desulfomicrobium apsheronum]SFK42829.1 ATP-dependent protease ClpP, protease subunit [Desulfomicrobium apsheronum]
MSAMHISARELLAKAESEARERVKAGKPVQLSPSPVFNAAKSEATLYLYDAIGAWYGIDPREWVPAFAAITAKTIHLRINSPGGAVLDAEAMRVAIAQHPSKVIAHIDGLCASAATGLAIAANEVEMASGGAFMIHNAWGICAGGEQEMLDYAALLRQTTGNIVATYQRRTGKPAAQIRKWMDAETWFTAEEAKSHGFVDRIFTPGQASNAADPGKAKRARALALAEISLKQI